MSSPNKESTNGYKLRATRQARKISLERLSELTGINRRSLYTYENGKVDPKLGDIIRIAEALQVTVAYLIDESDYMEDIDEAQLKLDRVVSLHKGQLQSAVLTVLQELGYEKKDKILLAQRSASEASKKPTNSKG